MSYRKCVQRLTIQYLYIIINFVYQQQHKSRDSNQSLSDGSPRMLYDYTILIIFHIQDLHDTLRKSLNHC